MKLATRILTGAFVAVLMAAPVLAQSVGDYRTRASGNWSMAQNWERFNGSAWAPIATPPSGSEAVITVMPNDSIFVNVGVTVTGRIVNQGRLATADLLTIGSGGTYQHDRDAGTMPTANWADGSTMHITGTVATAPASRNQSYYNVILDTPELLSNLNLDLNNATIGGDITVVSTGSARWYLTTAAANETATVTIMGDVNVQQGQFSVHGTGNALTTFVVNHYGNINVTGGNFSIARGGQANGTTTWTLHEGDFTMSNATSQNSVLTPQGGRFVFASGGEQRLVLGEGNTLQSLPIEVRNNTTLDMENSVMGGSGHFLVEAGSTLGTALQGGVSAIFPPAAVGQITLEDGAGFLFNGTAPQITSPRMPQVVGDLIINNVAGVTLSQETTINGVLRLQAGVFDNTIPFTLGPDGAISEEGGSLLFPVSSDPDAEALAAFRVLPNFPNPATGSTEIGFTLPASSAVTVTVYNVLGQTVLTALDEAVLPDGTHRVTLDLDGLSSGVYLYRVQSAFGEATQRMMVVR